MASDNGGPWGGGGGNRGDSGSGGGGQGPPNRGGGGGKRPGDDGPQIPPEIDELMKKGQEQLRVLMGGARAGGMPGAAGGAVANAALVPASGVAPSRW